MTADHAPNTTIAKFGYPDSLVADYGHWVVLLRPQQVTLAGLILACKGPAEAFPRIGPDAFAELERVTADIESCLGSAFAFDKINYLMLMMVDPHVHFHVFPRYAEERRFAGLSFLDSGWPAAPNLGAVNEVSEAGRAALLDHLRERWPAPSD